MPQPLMPKATAVWLVDNTSLTFEQIADFCQMHLLEVQAIADGEVAVGIVGLDPATNGQVDRQEIDRCAGDPSARLVMNKPRQLPSVKGRRTRYTPVSKRGDKPDAIAFVLRNHPEVSEAQISKLLGTTKATIRAIHDRSHWNSVNIKPRDPVLLGLCSQTDLNAVVARANPQPAVVAPETITAPAPEPEKDSV